MSVLFLTHGAGPLPLLGHPSQTQLAQFLKNLGKDYQDRYSRVVVFSAHHESQPIEMVTNTSSQLLYDYQGFPPESYQFHYPAPSDIHFIEKMYHYLKEADIPIQLNHDRGWDHGVFVPLMLMFPEAKMPIVQISLNSNLDADYHLALGSKLAEIDDGKTLWIGSGSSFHNLRLWMEGDPSKGHYSRQFHDWMEDKVVGRAPLEASEALSYWESAPGSQFCHPRSEHWIPIHYCQGIAQLKSSTCRQLIRLELMGQTVGVWAWS